MNSHSGGGSLGTSGSIVMATGGGLGGAWGNRITAVVDIICTIQFSCVSCLSTAQISRRSFRHTYAFRLHHQFNHCNAKLLLRVGPTHALYIHQMPMRRIYEAHLSLILNTSSMIQHSKHNCLTYCENLQSLYWLTPLRARTIVYGLSYLGDIRIPYSGIIFMGC